MHTRTPDLATEWIEQLIVDMADKTWPTEVHSLDRTLARWKLEIIALHHAHFSNGPTEAMNNLIQAREARRLWVHVVPELPRQVTALRRQAQLGATRRCHSPLRSEAPDSAALPVSSKCRRGISSLRSPTSLRCAW